MKLITVLGYKLSPSCTQDIIWKHSNSKRYEAKCKLCPIHFISLALIEHQQCTKKVTVKSFSEIIRALNTHQERKRSVLLETQKYVSYPLGRVGECFLNYVMFNFFTILRPSLVSSNLDLN